MLGGRWWAYEVLLLAMYSQILHTSSVMCFVVLCMSSMSSLQDINLFLDVLFSFLEVLKEFRVKPRMAPVSAEPTGMSLSRESVVLVA